MKEKILKYIKARKKIRKIRLLFVRFVVATAKCRIKLYYARLNLLYEEDERKKYKIKRLSKLLDGFIVVNH